MPSRLEQLMAEFPVEWQHLGPSHFADAVAYPESSAVNFRLAIFHTGHGWWDYRVSAPGGSTTGAERSLDDAKFAAHAAYCEWAASIRPVPTETR